MTHGNIVYFSIVYFSGHSITAQERAKLRIKNEIKFLHTKNK